VRKLKVWGINIDGVHRCIVAATSGRQAAMLFDVTVSYLYGWGSETGNEEELNLALDQPGTVFIKRDNNTDTYRVREVEL
jgi:hypothetical protein